MKKTVLKDKTVAPKKRKVSFNEKITDILLKDKNEILKDVAARTKSESSDSKSEIGDIFDIATSERERELSLIFGDRDREKLAEIEDSLEGIGNGTYGFCESCEEPIGEERLIVMPFTKVCIECKAKDEKTSGSRRKYAEGMGVISDKIDSEGEE